MTIAKNELDPSMDGINHINVYSKGKTRLGRLLTNLSDLPVYNPTYGRFRCGEGFWYYLSTGCQYEDLRSLNGFEAKRYGRTLPKVWMSNFQEEFKLSLKWKIENHAELRDLFYQSTLPFTHYYFYTSKKPDVVPKVIVPKGCDWMMEFFETIRSNGK